MYSYKWAWLTVVELSIIGLGDGNSDLHRHDWQVNTIDGPTKLVRQDAIFGELSLGQLFIDYSNL